LKILLLTPSRPWPPNCGTYQRTNLICRALSEVGEVHVALLMRSFHVELATEDEETMRAEFGLRAVHWQAPAGARWPWKAFGLMGSIWPERIARLVKGRDFSFIPDRDIHALVETLHKENGYDLIVTRFLSSMAVGGLDAFAPVIVDIDDLPSEVLSSKIQEQDPKGLRGRYWRYMLRKVRLMENEILARSAHAWVVKTEDLEHSTACQTSVLNNIPYCGKGEAFPAPCEPNAASRAILMVGSLAHAPNVRAIDGFINECFAHIRAQVPEAVFRIVGFGMTEAMREKWRAIPGVEPIGFVESVREAYADAAFAICPLREGAGSNIKVMEALMHGRAIICTHFGAKGFTNTLRNGESILIEDDWNAFAERCSELLRNPERAQLLAESGYEEVRRHYSFESFASVVRESVESVVGDYSPQPSVQHARKGL